MSYVPVTQFEQGRYIQAATKPFERLARLWECEDRTRCEGLDRNTPRDIADARFRAFWSVWDAKDRVEVAA